MENENKEKLLSIKDLRVQYTSDGEAVNAVNGVDLDLYAGEALGLVGETGAGKTTIAKTIMRILPDHAVRSVEGTIEFKGKNVLELPDKEIRGLRGKSISMIFQDPMTALNPVQTVVDQIAESLALHHHETKKQSINHAIEILERVGISPDRANEYPHQFSGGMKQRVVIAIAISCQPELLIADEPTTALDVTIQAQVLELINEIRESLNTTLILITHDLGVVAEVCDSVAVVYGGEIVESGTIEAVYDNPLHPYTQGLFAAVPDIDHDVSRLSPIEGMPPDPTNLPEGCVFHPRCRFATEECKKEHIPMTEIEDGHFCRCCKAKNLEV